MNQSTRLGTTLKEGMKTPVVVATTLNIALQGLPLISGAQLVACDRILVRTQNNKAENGIYVVASGTWDRAKDFNASNDVVNGQLVIDSNSGLLYRVHFTGEIDLGVTLLSFFVAEPDSRSKQVDTLADWQNDLTAQLRDVVTTAEYSTGNGGGGTGDVIASGTENGANIVKHNTLPLSWELRIDNEVNMLQFGMDKTGVIVATTLSALAQTVARDLGVSARFPAGTYKGNFEFDSNVQIICDGQGATIFTQDSDATACVKVAEYSGGFGGFDNKFGGCSILGGATGRGLQLGKNSSTGFSTSQVSNIKIIGFDTGLFIQSALVSSLNSIWVRDCTSYALHIPSSVNCTTLGFNGCRFWTSMHGALLETGFNITFNYTSFESNTDSGIRIVQSSDTGPTGIAFNTCWVEDNGGRGIHIAQEVGIYATKKSTLLFKNTTVNSAVGIPPLEVVRGSDIYFEHCVLQRMDEIIYRDVDDEVQVYFDQCSDSVQLRPDRSMYSGLQPLTYSADKTQAWGIFFKIKEEGNVLFANYTTGEESTLSLTATNASLDVQGFNRIAVDTTAGPITLTEMVNAPFYTLMTIVVAAGGNDLTVVHSAGSQKILLIGGANKILPVRTGIQLIRTPTAWMEVVVA